MSVKQNIYNKWKKKKTSSEWSEKVSCHYWFKKEDCNIGINLQKGHEVILVKKQKNWNLQSDCELNHRKHISKRKKKNATAFICQTAKKESLSIWNVPPCVTQSSNCPMIVLPSMIEITLKMKFMSLSG